MAPNAVISSAGLVIIASIGAELLLLVLVHVAALAHTELLEALELGYHDLGRVLATGIAYCEGTTLDVHGTMM